MKIFFHCSAVSCKLKVSYIWFACNLKNYRTHDFFFQIMRPVITGRMHNFSMHPVNCTESGKIQKLSFFHNFWAHSIKQMMHRFYSWVGRTCVHAVPLNCVRNPLGCASWVRKIQRYLVYTISYRPTKTCASFAYCIKNEDASSAGLTKFSLHCKQRVMDVIITSQ